MQLRSVLLAILLLCAVGACTKKNPAFCDEESPCTDPATPYCDIDGDFGDRNTCIPIPFDAGVPMFDAAPLPDGPATLAVSVSGSGSGTVTSAPTGIDCGSACDAEFAQGTEVTLSSAPEPGTTFVTWGGDCPRGFADCVLTMSSDRSVTASFGLTGEHLYSAGYGAAGDDAAHDVAFDNQGNLAIAGSFSGTVDFGDGNPITADDARDGFVAKYDADGELVWVVPFGGTGDDTMYAVAFDPAGDVYATGNLEEDATVARLLITKLAATDGEQLWQKDIVGTLGGAIARSIATDGTHVISVGYFSNVVDFGGGDIMSRGLDGFVLWHTTSGSFVRAKRVFAVSPDLAFELVTDVAIDDSGAIYATGWTNGSFFDLGGGNLPQHGEWDIFLVKYSNTGAHLWSNRYGGAADDLVESLSIDAANDVYITGSFVEAADFGDGTVAANTASIGGQDAFVASYSGDTGNYRWMKQFADTFGTNRGTGIAASPRGTVYATGTFEQSVDFGGGVLMSAGENDIYVAALDTSTAAHDRSTSYGASDDDATSSPDEVTAVAVDDVGRVAIVGFTANTLSFGGPPVASIGGTDFFVAVFGP